MLSNLLIDPVICEEACRSSNSRLSESLSIARKRGVRIWVYAGSAAQIIENLGGTREAREELAKFTRDMQWLAALGEDCLASLQVEANEVTPLEIALERLSGESKILTERPNLFQSDLSITLGALADLASTPGEQKIDFIDLKSQQDQIRPELESRIHQVLQHGQYILGPEIVELETRLAHYVGVDHCISASSGTDTLLIALMALEIQPGDEVITVPYTWISTAEVISLIGAVPVFVDIEETTWNLDPDLLEAAITSRTKAIMPVGIYGQCPNMSAINAIADRHGLPVIEDAAQSFGATYNGRKSCSLSTIGSTSFFPSKPLGAYGDGGALFTDDEALARRMRQIRVHGQERKHYHPIIGINGRCDTLQAAIVLTKLDVFDEECEKRSVIGNRYTELFQKRNIESVVATPKVGLGNESVFAQYTILVNRRDEVQSALSEAGIPSVAYYVAPLHLQPAFASLGIQKGAYPVTESVSDRCLSLPMHPNLDETVQERIVDIVASVFNQ